MPKKPKAYHDITDTYPSEYFRYRVQDFFLSPQQWRTCAVRLEWQMVKFERSNSIRIPKDEQGVYSFVVKPEIAGHPECSYLVYIGKTEKRGFRKRFLDYFGEPIKKKPRERVKRMIMLWPENLWFLYAKIEDISSIDSIEHQLLEAYAPPSNDDIPGLISEIRGAWGQ